ncbi:hypothetical protein ABIE13_003780 [Ottowia thiooxydans]|uniref:Serine protease n=2 Tax=Ottowia thiooxydans TaxID=219182 RepID=A0ABV2QCA8_9BURK
MPSLDVTQDFSKVLQTEIVEDPGPQVPIGTSLIFEAGLITTNQWERATWLRNWHVFSGMLLAIHFAGADGHTVDGSAVVVGPGIALCAKHVVEPHLEGLLSGQIACLATGASEEGLQAWRISKVNEVPNTDLYIIGLTLASNVPKSGTFHQAVVSARIPEVGESLTLCGFRLDHTEAEIAGQSMVLHFAGNLLCCRGEVSQVFPQGRDRAMLPWPSVEVRCPAWGGMSGGPVFNTSGQLVGLVCSSFSDEEDSGPAYVSLLGPALTQGFSGGWPIEMSDGSSNLTDLSTRGVVTLV